MWKLVQKHESKYMRKFLNFFSRPATISPLSSWTIRTSPWEARSSLRLPVRVLGVERTGNFPKNIENSFYFEKFQNKINDELNMNGRKMYERAKKEQKLMISLKWCIFLPSTIMW